MITEDDKDPGILLIGAIPTDSPELTRIMRTRGYGPSWKDYLPDSSRFCLTDYECQDCGLPYRLPHRTISLMLTASAGGTEVQTYCIFCVQHRGRQLEFTFSEVSIPPVFQI